MFSSKRLIEFSKCWNRRNLRLFYKLLAVFLISSLSYCTAIQQFVFVIYVIISNKCMSKVHYVDFLRKLFVGTDKLRGYSWKFTFLKFMSQFCQA